MSVVHRNKSLLITNRFHLQLYHYARGTYPAADGSVTTMLVNRCLIPLGSTDAEESYVSDENHYYPMRPGCAYFIPAFHKAGVKLTENMRFLSIQFLLDFYNGIDVFSSFRQIMEIEDPTITQRANEAFEIESPYQLAPRLHSVVFDFVSRIFEKTDVDKLNLDVLLLPSFQDLNRLSETCTAATTVAELADLCGLCRDTFSRTFIRKNGISPKQFLNRCILHRAYTLLSAGDMKVNEVAKELHFTNEFYFSRFFKKHTGFSPKQFRRVYGH